MDAARRAGAKGIEVRLLGPVEALRNGAPVALGGPKPRTLLTVLALDLGRVVSVDHLVEALWPGAAPDTAPHAIQVYVSQLRKALGPVIATRAPGYVLEVAPDGVDVHRFMRLAADGSAALQADAPEAAEGPLREALALWRGPALADFLYEPFAQTEIARLEELRTVVLEERIEADLALGRHAELVSELEALVQAQPHRERPRAQVMLALYRSGRQADALAAYRAAREELVEELGIEPGPELKELEAAILRQDESLLLARDVAARPAMQFRRLATILFVDVVDSMAVAEVLDPEALASVQQRYLETVSAAIARHGGTVEKYAGDAVMAAFGIPVAHEDDALRAARAALDIRVGVAALGEQLLHEHDLGLEIRIGLAAGEVVAASTGSRQRFVAGDAVGVAARLEQSAQPGEIVVGDVVARLIDHAASLEPLGELEMRNRKAPLRMFRLVELIPVSPAFGRRLDAPLIGRKRELAALRRALREAKDTGSVRASLILGSAGVGKSRLAVEFARRTRGVTALFGRCLAYGEGITYGPLRDVLEQAEGGAERDAILAALEADTPPTVAEIAWSFRAFCESLASERPLVLVFDDVHWAEPTFLELIEQIADRATGPILVVCAAREELLEDHPQFFHGRENAARIALDALSAEETNALLASLSGGVLETDQQDRIVGAAEGNPFFLEQLVALGLEGGLAEDALPETVQALLAARLDRLGPGERAVLERGAVIGKEFRLDDVGALLEPGARLTVADHLHTLVARGFVRPVVEGEFSFRHVLAQQAVYRAAPKRLRAELHERFVDLLEERAAGVGDADELAGYHLEQAYRLRTDLGESDMRTAQLREDAGTRLGDAGVRASKRGDIPASITLLRRATGLLPEGMPRVGELLCEFGIARRAAGDFEGASTTLEEAIEHAVRVGDDRMELRARMELEYVLLPRTTGVTADRLLSAASQAIPVFEAARDDRSLGRAWLFVGWARGGRRGNHAAREEAAETALAHYKLSSWPTSTCLGEIAAALYFGPKPVVEALVRCDELLREASDRIGSAHVQVYYGGLVAQRGEFDEARDLISAARAVYEELGQRTAAAHNADAILGEVELLAGDAVAAEATLRSLCEELERTRAYSHLASRAGDLAEALYLLGRIDEAAGWTAVAETHSADDDLDAFGLWMPVRAKIVARNGMTAEAAALAWEAVERGAESDALNRRAKALTDLGEVLFLADRLDDAREAVGRAVRLFEEKGNVVAAARTRERLAGIALV